MSKFNIDEILSMNIYIPHHSVSFLLYQFFYSVKRSASEISFGNHLRYVSQVNKRLQELLFWRIWKKRSNHINILTSAGFNITVRINKLPDNDYWLIVYFSYFFLFLVVTDAKNWAIASDVNEKPLHEHEGPLLWILFSLVQWAESKNGSLLSSIVGALKSWAPKPCVDVEISANQRQNSDLKLTLVWFLFLFISFYTFLTNHFFPHIMKELPS